LGSQTGLGGGLGVGGVGVGLLPPPVLPPDLVQPIAIKTGIADNKIRR